ncbi:MAG: hypothetical protein J3Q66DRAFT_404926 [Benniella sp.]|nr:MAG: hypothetical protein J3Q66DRAFT_404926 [Benniella sp.]
MVFGSIVPSNLRSLSLKQALELTNLYLENAYKVEIRDEGLSARSILNDLHKANPESTLNCLANIWITQQVVAANNNEAWWQVTLYSQVFDLCFQLNGWNTKQQKDACRTERVAKGDIYGLSSGSDSHPPMTRIFLSKTAIDEAKHHTGRSEIPSTTLKTARSNGMDVPNHRVDFVVTPSGKDVDALTGEDKPESSAKVEKDLAKNKLIQQTALWLWRHRIGPENKDLLAELEVLGCQWVRNKFIVTGTRLLGNTFVHYNKAIVEFPLRLKGATTALGLLVIISLERALTPHFKKMNLILEDRAVNQISHLELSSNGDYTCYYFQADLENCLAEIREMSMRVMQSKYSRQWRQHSQLIDDMEYTPEATDTLVTVNDQVSGS